VLIGAIQVPVLLAFGALTLALAALWAPRVSASAHAAQWWTLPFVLAVVAALAGGLVDARGVLVLLLFAAACLVANRAAGRGTRRAAHAVMLAACAGLLLHVIPGFDNPRVLDQVVLGSGSEPYTKYLSFDKGVVGLFLLGIYAPDRVARDEGLRHGVGFLWRFAILTAAVMGLSLASGYIRWDPKLPSWWPLWTWSMIFLTALPEEAIFRGVAQSWLGKRLGGTSRAATVAAVMIGTLFGLAHIGGGPVYVVLATAAGIGYGWIYAATRSIGAAVAAHAGLNIIHFVLFSYPSLRVDSLN
jgi:membrane protease YdiL (CAAX protease family)